MTLLWHNGSGCGKCMPFRLLPLFEPILLDERDKLLLAMHALLRTYVGLCGCRICMDLWRRWFRFIRNY